MNNFWKSYSNSPLAHRTRYKCGCYAFLARTSIDFQVFELAQVRGVTLISSSTLVELEDVSAREKFDRYVSRDQRFKLFGMYFMHLEHIMITEDIHACRDPRDDKFLSLAISGRADIIISGDADLLELHPFQGVAILSPASYLARQITV